ncbi:glutamine synthetase, partial [Burkholderia multivorans]
ELAEEAEDNVWLLSDTERRAMGIRALPASLAEAVEIMEGSDLVAETLGEEVFDFFLRNKRQEWTEYRAQVTPYELSKHFSSM